jgi:hypothetical protein
MFGPRESSVVLATEVYICGALDCYVRQSDRRQIQQLMV